MPGLIIISVMTFNPTLVQFKHTEETLEEMNVETFNPTLVQFKHEV